LDFWSKCGIGVLPHFLFDGAQAYVLALIVVPYTLKSLVIHKTCNVYTLAELTGSGQQHADNTRSVVAGSQGTHFMAIALYLTLGCSQYSPIYWPVSAKAVAHAVDRE
jgi:hypothetical protein